MLGETETETETGLLVLVPSPSSISRQINLLLLPFSILSLSAASIHFSSSSHFSPFFFRGSRNGPLMESILLLLLSGKQNQSFPPNIVQQQTMVAILLAMGKAPIHGGIGWGSSMMMYITYEQLACKVHAERSIYIGLVPIMKFVTQ